MPATTITVGIPAYNAARWIDATLASVLAQTRQPDEILVVDDGSEDDTAERARSHGATVVQQQNQGPSAAYNKTFDLAKTDYVAMCPADDIWEHSKLEVQAETLAADPEVDITFGKARYFGLKGGEHPHPRQAGRQDHDRFLRDMFSENLIATPTAVVRRDLHQRLGRFDETLHCEDYEFWMRALRAKAVFNYDPHQMVNLRQHGDNVSAKALEIWEMMYRVRSAYVDDVADPDLSRRTLARDLREIARCRFGADRALDARAAYAESWRQQPSVEALVGRVALGVEPSRRFLTAVNRGRRRRPARS